MSDTIFIDGSFNGHYLTGNHPNGSRNKRTMCQSHNKQILPYLEWHAKAELNEAKGIRQTQCQICLYWFYPDEI